MRIKIIVIIIVLIGILIFALFGFGLKEMAIKEMVKNIPEYSCNKDNLCTSCIIKGHTCSCGENKCRCGNETIDRAECEL